MRCVAFVQHRIYEDIVYEDVNNLWFSLYVFIGNSGIYANFLICVFCLFSVLLLLLLLLLFKNIVQSMGLLFWNECCTHLFNNNARTRVYVM